MLIVFFTAIAILVYTFVGYPLVVAIIAVLFGKIVYREDITPSVSLIISAYNEGTVIREKLDNTLLLDYQKEKLEVIVASEATDETNSIVMEYADRGIVLHAYENREGKSATLFRSVPRAKGEIIVFSDANAMYRKDAIKKLVRNFADKRIGCVSGRLIYVNPEESAIGDSESVYWEYEFLLKRLLSRLFSLSGSVNGSIFAIRKTLYSPISKYRGDDFELANRIQIAGYGVIQELEAVSYEEVSKTSGQEFERKVRTATGNLKSTVLLMGEALRRWKILTTFLLLSHRFLRYMMPLWCLVMFFSNFFILDGIYIYFFTLQVLFLLMALLGFILERCNNEVHTIFLLPFYFCMVNWAALIAVLKNLFNQTETTWEKVR